GAEYGGRGKRSLVRRDQAWIALDDAAAGLRDQLRKHRGKHDLVAQSLFPGDEKSAPRKSESIPARQAGGSGHMIKIQAAQFIALPAAFEVSYQELRHGAVKQ